MTTGIPLLDNIINGVNTAVNTATNIISGIQNTVTQTTQTATSQLGSFISGFQNGIGGSVSGVQNLVIPQSTSYAPTVYNATGNQFATYQQPPIGTGIPVAVAGQSYYPGVYNPYGNQYAQYYQAPPIQSYAPINYNVIQQMLNTAFAQLPNIIATIQNPYNSPYLTTIFQLITNLYNQQSQTVTNLNTFIKSLESQAYQSASNGLRSVGIDVGDFSNLLDATVRKVMDAIGYPQQQSFSDLMQFIQQGNAQQNNTIQGVTNTINDFLRNFTGENQKLIEDFTRLTGYPGVVSPFQPQDIISQAVDSAGKELQKVLSSVVNDATTNPQNFVNQLSTRINDISDVIQHLKEGRYRSSDELFNALFGNEPASGLARALVILASIIPTLISAVNLSGAPALEAFGYLINADNPVKKLGLSEYVNAYFKQIIDYGELSQHAKKLGIGSDELKTLLLQSLNEPPLQYMVSARRRAVISDSDWNAWLDDLRLTDTGKKIFNYLLDEIPGPSDLTRIADKRVWSLQTQPKYGQFSEVPKEYYDYMKMWGYENKFIDWLWAAHWELPSPNQVFEMAHRGLINQEDMDTYLGLTDWLPYFRDKLFQITFNVLTRVDVRRLYKEGLLSDSELHQQHLKMGYTEEDARKLDAYVQHTSLPEDETEFTSLEKRVRNAVEKGYSTGRIDRNEAVSMLTYLGVSQELALQELNILDFEMSINNIEPTQKSLQANAVSVIRAAYKKGNISRQDAQQYLMASGYGQGEADQELYFLDLENTIRLKSLSQDTAQKLLATFEIDDVEFHNRLNALGFSAREVELSYQEALLMRDSRTKKLSYAQLQKLFKNGILSVEEYANQLKGLGYTDQSVFWLISNEIPPDGGIQ